MSWHFSRALAEAYSQDTCSDGEQSALSNTNPMPLLYSSSGKMMEFCSRSRSGMTCEPLTDTLGADLLTSFLADFPVRTSVRQEREPASQASAPASGKRWRESFAKFDRDSSSWKTPRSLPLAGLTSSSVTWPRWGSMLNGVCSELPTPELRTKGIGSGFWPTPAASDGGRGGRITPGMTGQSLPQMVNSVLYPTPTSTNTKAVHMRGSDKGKAREPRSYFPTPLALDWRSGKGRTQEERGRSAGSASLAESQGGQLNPDWVEWLMGWPIGWTSFGQMNQQTFLGWQRAFRIVSGGSKELEMDRFRRAL